MAVVDDFNGDGVKEFLTVYESAYLYDSEVIMYELWSLRETGKKLIRVDDLFFPAGGNFGKVGIVKSGNTTYLAIEKCEQQGGDIYDYYYIYIPFSTTESKLEEDAVYLQMTLNVGEDGEVEKEYILGDTRVDSSEFEARYQEFSNWIYQLDIESVSKNEGIMTYEELLNSLE